MRSKGPKTIAALSTAFASALAITGLVARKRKSGEGTEIHIAEPSVKKVPRVRKIGSRKAAATKAAITTEVLKEMFKEIKQKSLSNEDIARIITSLISLQNAVNPSTAIDIRNIHFIKSGKQNTMVIDFYTSEHDKPEFMDELDWVWRDVFLADDFWNADFTKVRINVRNKRSSRSIESITCSPEDIHRYLTKEISPGSFRETWTRKKTKATRKESPDKKVRKLKRA